MPPVDLSIIATAICEKLGLTYVSPAGEGSFKENFQVRDNFNQSFALKVYKPGRFREERSEREIRAMQRCDHPGIARLFSVSSITVEGTEFFFTIEEFLGGGTLTDRLEHNRLMSVSDVLSLGSHLIDAVGHIASLDLVHRDIKPDNILFREGTNIAVIVDFGVVRDLSAESLTGTWVASGPGTPYFAAPEQLNNEKELIDWRTDQFALGLVLAYCAFGNHPFDSGRAVSPVQVVAQRRSPSSDFRRSVQECGLPVLTRMIAPWPVSRYRTPSELAEAWSKQAGA